MIRCPTEETQPCPLAAAVCANERRPGEGKLRLTLAHRQKVDKFSAEMVSDLGELVVIDKLDEPIPVPYGEYRVSWLRLETTDTDGRSWDYSFGRNKRRYVTVPRGQETTVRLLGKIVMQVTCDAAQEKAKPGETVIVRPQVVADDEMLYLSSCGRAGEDRYSSPERSAEILVLSRRGEMVSRGLSGFS